MFPIAHNMHNFKPTNKSNNILNNHKINSIITRNVVIIENIMHKKDTLYGIYLCVEEEKFSDNNFKFNDEMDLSNTFKIIGVFPMPLIPMRTYKIKGKITQYNGEYQIFAQEFTEIQPIQKYSIISFLQSLPLSNNIISEKIYEKYKEDVFNKILKNPQEMQLNFNIKKTTLLLWQKEIEKIKSKNKNSIELMKLGLTPSQIKKLYTLYEDKLICSLKENPYILIEALDGFNFKKCDKIAMKLKYPHNGKERISEAIRYILDFSFRDGHCYVLLKNLLKNTQKILETKSLKNNTSLKQIDTKLIEDQIKHLISNKLIAVEKDSNNNKENPQTLSLNDKIYDINVFYFEEKTSRKIIELKNTQRHNFENSTQELNELLREREIILEIKQEEACRTFTSSSGGFYVLDGSAGCGKTFVINIVLQLLEKQYKKNNLSFDVGIFAPTGKAAKVASFATKRECKTIHRGLKYNPETGFEINEFNQLEYDCLVIDETSMLDIELCHSLLLAIKNGTKVILVGDSKQLPSIGAGKVLLDIINSGVVPVVTLEVPKRQKLESGIINNATNIINKEMIASQKNTKDAYIINLDDTKNITSTLRKVIKDTKRALKCNLDDIMILTPQKSGHIGVNDINDFIQKEFNESNDYIEDEGKIFKVGDKVMHTTNNYQKEWHIKNKFGFYTSRFDITGIANGECGVIKEIIREEIFERIKTTLVVEYDDGCIFYTEDYSELTHAYALTIHKSQGSQWKAVILLIFDESRHMLNNNLLYTGYTRAQEFCVVIGQKDAIKYGIKNERINERKSGLCEKLKKQEIDINYKSIFKKGC